MSAGSSGVQGNYVDQAWAHNLPAFFKENVKPCVANDAFLIPRENIAIPNIVTMNTLGAVNDRGFIDKQRTRFSTIRNAILNPSTYVKRLHPSDLTSGTGGIDNLSNFSRFGQPLPFADAEDFPDFQYWSKYTKDSGADPLTAGYAVKAMGEDGEELAASMKADREQQQYRIQMQRNVRVAEALGRGEEDRRARAERMADAAVLAEEDVRRAQDDLIGEDEEVDEEEAADDEDVVNEVPAPADIGAAPEPEGAAAARAPVNVELDVATGGLMATREARTLKRIGYALQIYESTVLSGNDRPGSKRIGIFEKRVFKAVYRHPVSLITYVSLLRYDAVEGAERNDVICRHVDTLADELRNGSLQGYEPYVAGVERVRPYALSDVGSIGDFNRASTISTITVQSATRGPAARSARGGSWGASSMNEEMVDRASTRASTVMSEAMEGLPGAAGTAMSIAQSAAVRSGVRNILRDQAPLLGPNSINWEVGNREDIREVADLQEFMGSSTNNLAALFSNAYTATPAFKKPRKQGVEGEYKKSGGTVGPAIWGSMYEPRVEQTSSAGGDVFSTAEKQSDPRYALLHGRKPSASTYLDPNLAYTSGTFRQLESQSRSNRYDGNIDGPAEQNSLAIQNPAHARNMAHRVAAEFAHAPPESRQTGGVLNKNQRVPISSVTVANRGSTSSNDQASAFRAGAPRPRR